LDENAVKGLFFGQFGQARNLPDNLKFVMAVKVVAFGALSRPFPWQFHPLCLPFS